MKTDMAKRVERAKLQDVKYRDSPDIVVKVVCKYRAELYFKISRKTKFSRLFCAWTDRMDSAMALGGLTTGKGGRQLLSADMVNGAPKANPSKGGSDTMRFIFSHGGRTLEPEQTPEEVGMEAGDEILAVELMDLTEGPGTEVVVGGISFFFAPFLVPLLLPRLNWLRPTADPRPRVRTKVYLNQGGRNWSKTGLMIPKSTFAQSIRHFTNCPTPSLRAKKAMEELFDNVVRERLKDILRQYELRERHFECVIRSKELEVLLSRARAAEQQQLAEGQASRTAKAEQEVTPE